MTIDTLVRMANDIGNFFGAEAEKAQAARDVATHLKKFWDPRMREQIIAHYRRGGVGLSDHVRDAVGLLASEPHGTGRDQSATR
ncbi:MAG: formate dehydrogenase subunit delta [Gemmatimonadetes bacterium]|nr:formate dehydrogenase subunit delta [Gemmatimonadota bacterium]